MLCDRLKDMSIGFEARLGHDNKNRPLLVMIHGAGGSSQVWKNQVNMLDDSIDTLALDLPGHGTTGGRSKNLVEEYAQWLAKVLGDLCDRPVFLMGHSMGGAVVLETALHYPELLKGIILVGTGPLLRVAPAFLKGFSDKFEETIDMVMGYAYASGADLSMVREGAGLMKKAGPKVVFDDFTACDRFDRRKELEKIDLPCLIMCGEEDKLTPPALSETLNKSIRHSILTIVPSAGHHAMIESYETFNRCVEDFVLPPH